MESVVKVWVLAHCIYNITHIYIVVYIYTYAYIYIDTYRHIHIHIRRHRHILHVLCIYIHGSYVYIQYILYVYIILVGGLEHVLFFHFIYGLSSFPLTNSIICQRGRAQPPTRIDFYRSGHFSGFHPG